MGCSCSLGSVRPFPTNIHLPTHSFLLYFTFLFSLLPLLQLTLPCSTFSKWFSPSFCGCRRHFPRKARFRIFSLWAKRLPYTSFRPAWTQAGFQDPTRTLQFAESNSALEAHTTTLHHAPGSGLSSWDLGPGFLPGEALTGFLLVPQDPSFGRTLFGLAPQANIRNHCRTTE